MADLNFTLNGINGQYDKWISNIVYIRVLLRAHILCSYESILLEYMSIKVKLFKDWWMPVDFGITI